MAAGGRWFKSFDEELEDPKIEDLNDSEYRIWRAMLDYCNRSPARLGERGYLYHSQGFPVTPQHIARKLNKPLEEVNAAIATLCAIGGPSSLIILEQNAHGNVIRVRAWRKRQRGKVDDVAEDVADIPEDIPIPSQFPPALSPLEKRREEKNKRREEKEDGLVPAADAPEPRSTWPAESSALKSIPGYPFDEKKDRPLFDLLAETYQQLDLTAEVKKCHAWLMSNNQLPLKGVAGPRKRIRGWIERADSYGRNNVTSTRPMAGQARRNPPATAADYGESGTVKI